MMIRLPALALGLLLSGAIAAHAQSTKQGTSAARKADAPTPQDQTAALNLAAYAELLRADVKLQKVAILTEMMGFTEAEDAAFWPIYRDYDSEMANLGDERVALIAEYARVYEKMTDADATALADKALDLESRRQAAKAKYFERVRKALSAKTALKYLQIEHQLLLLIDLQISAALPIVK